MELLINGIISLTVTMSAVIILMLLLSGVLSKKFTASCRYLLWSIIIIRLAIPLGGVFVKAPITVDVPDINAGADIIDYKANTTTPDLIIDGESALPPISDDKIYIPSETSEVLGGFNIMPSTEIIDDIPKLEVGSNYPASQPIDSIDNVTPVTPDDEMLATPLKFTPEVILKLIMLLWAVGAVVSLGYCIISYVILTVKLSRMREVCRDEVLIKSFYSACAEFSVKNKPSLYISNHVRSPIIYGFFRPTVLLPYEMNSLSDIGDVMAHEVVHYKRHDIYMKLISRVALAVNWFNPLVYIAVDKFTQTQELSCDEIVLRDKQMQERLNYSNTMLEMIKAPCSKEEQAMGAGLTTHFNPSARAVKERFKNILDMKTKHSGIILAVIMLTLAVFAGTLIACRNESADSPADDITTQSETTEAPEESSAESDENNETDAPETEPQGAVRVEVLYKALLESMFEPDFAEEFATRDILGGAANLINSNNLDAYAIFPNGDVIISEDGTPSAYYKYSTDEYIIAAPMRDIVHYIPIFEGDYVESSAIKLGEVIEFDHKSAELIFEQDGKLFVYASAYDKAYELPFARDSIKLDLNEFAYNSHLHTTKMYNHLAFSARGCDIGGDENYGYIFILREDIGCWFAAALPTNSGTCGYAEVRDNSGVMMAYISSSDEGVKPCVSVSYEGIGKWSPYEPTTEITITAAFVSPEQRYTATLSSIQAATINYLLSQYPITSYDGAAELSENYIHLTMYDGRSYTIYDNGLLLDTTSLDDEEHTFTIPAEAYENIAQIVGRISSRTYAYVNAGTNTLKTPAIKDPKFNNKATVVCDHWSYTSALGQSKDDFSEMSLTLYTYDPMITINPAGDYKYFDTVTFHDNGIKLVRKGNDIDSILPQLKKYDDKIITMRDIATLIVDGVEYPLQVYILSSKKEMEFNFYLMDENGAYTIDYNTVSAIHFKLGNTVNRVETLAELPELGYATDSYLYRYLEAMLDPANNLDKLAEMSYKGSTELVESYKSLKYGEMYFETISISSNFSMLVWNVEVLESEVDGICPGWHSYIVEEGMLGATITENVTYDLWAKYSQFLEPERAESVIQMINASDNGIVAVPEFIENWFFTCGENMIPAYGTWESYDVATRSALYQMAFDYLSVRHGMLTKDEINSYGAQAFGIDNLFEKAGVERIGDKAGDKYGMPGHGANVWMYDVVGIYQYDDRCTVELQFWADMRKTVTSHIVAYELDLANEPGETDKYIGCKIIKKSNYSPIGMAV